MVKTQKEMLTILMKSKLDLLMRMKIKSRKRRRKKSSLKMRKKMLIIGKRMIPNTIRTWKTLTLAKYKNTDMGIEVTLTDSSVMSHSRIQLFSFSYCLSSLRYFAIIMYNNIQISTSNLFILHFQVERSFKSNSTVLIRVYLDQIDFDNLEILEVTRKGK